MKKIALFFLLIFPCCSLAMKKFLHECKDFQKGRKVYLGIPLKIPSVDILKKSLVNNSGIKFKSFFEKTKMFKNFEVSKEMSPYQIVLLVDGYLFVFLQKNNLDSELVDKTRIDILNSILKDYPNELMEVKKRVDFKGEQSSKLWDIKRKLYFFEQFK